MATIENVICSQATYDALGASQQALYVNHYLTINDFDTAVPADISSATGTGEKWRATILKDASTIAMAPPLLTAKVTDPANNCELYVKPADRVQLLDFNSGVSISGTVGYAPGLIDIPSNNTVFVGMGLINQSATGNVFSNDILDAAGIIFDSCSIESKNNNPASGYYALYKLASDAVVKNCIIKAIKSVSSNTARTNQAIYNNTFVSNVPGSGEGAYIRAGSGNVMSNNIFLDFEFSVNASNGATGSNNVGSDISISDKSLGTITNVTSADFLRAIDNDFRIETASQLATYAALDLLATVPDYYDGALRQLPMRVGALPAFASGGTGAVTRIYLGDTLIFQA